jgi:NarL family two-component system response regulator LiaR
MQIERASYITRVLIVDDQPVFREGIKGMLRPFPDIRVIGEAESGIEAIQAAVQLRPDVVLMDVNMPGMDGIETTKGLLRHIPEAIVIGVSVIDDSEKVLEMLNAGARGYILKSCKPSELANAIRVARDGKVSLARDMATKIVVELASKKMSLHEVEPLSENVTEREKAILTLVVKGFSNKEIAKELHMAESTVASYLDNIYRKLGVQSRTAAAIKALRLKLVEL